MSQSLNGVRPRWPEQSALATGAIDKLDVSMESGLDGRNNARIAELDAAITALVSMESGLDGRNNYN